MNSPRDDKALSHVYREGAWPEPNRQIEQAIRATEREQRSFARRWGLPFALAAGALLAFGLMVRAAREKPQPIAASPPAASGAKVEQSPATPDVKAAVEPQAAPPSARAPAPPSPATTPPYAMRRDEAERLGLLQPDVGLKAGSPASASAPPPAPKAALKKDSAERAPKAPTFLPSRPPQAWIEDIRKLKAEGKAEEAALALAEFRKRNPDYVLPEDMR